MKLSQKLRLVINGISFFTTVKQIRSGIGDDYRSNAAAQKCLLVLEMILDQEKIQPSGLAGQWEGYNVQLDIINEN